MRPYALHLTHFQHKDGSREAAPEVTRDDAFISKCLLLRAPEEISVYSPFRTTSILQSFQEKPGHDTEKPYACRVPVLPETKLRSNLEGRWAMVMLTDVRGHERLFSLDKDGFEWLQSSPQIDVLDPKFDPHAYMEEMIRFLRHWYRCEVTMFAGARIHQTGSPDTATLLREYTAVRSESFLYVAGSSSFQTNLTRLRFFRCRVHKNYPSSFDIPVSFSAG